MTERKILNKYYPHDFDPSKVYKRKKSGGKVIKVRTMIPFTVMCNNCGSFLYKGSKFNTIKKIINTQDYLTVPIYRFYMNCSVCNSIFYFRTDPKTGEYLLENGAQKIYVSQDYKINNNINSKTIHLYYNCRSVRQFILKKIFLKKYYF
mmetsp:Transcript_9715/g.17735  ORF Transcript_9715/g.17735 Transcript_9715/m.17735 type:complete len:149 (+) Transcript_9715:536-982(+)